MLIDFFLLFPLCFKSISAVASFARAAHIGIMLRSHCTIFCKRLNALAEIRHTDLLERSDCKIFACRKKLARAKKLVGLKADCLHACANETYCELFISEVNSDLLYGVEGTYQSERENADKCAFTQAKACTQRKAFNVKCSLARFALHWPFSLP